MASSKSSEVQRLHKSFAMEHKHWLEVTKRGDAVHIGRALTGLEMAYNTLLLACSTRGDHSTCTAECSRMYHEACALYGAAMRPR